MTWQDEAADTGQGEDGKSPGEAVPGLSAAIPVLSGEDKEKSEMDIREFAENVRLAAEMTLGLDYEVKVSEVRKNNGICRTGLLVLEQGRNVAPTIYLERLHEAFEGGLPFGDAVSQVLQAYERDRIKGKVDTEFFRNFEEVRERICYRLVGTKGNEGLLEEIPHVGFLDLAICFYYAYYDEGIGSGSILIHNSHMRMWGTRTEELYRLAEQNTPRLFPWASGKITEFLDIREQEGSHKGKGGCGLKCPWDISMWVLTNSSRVNGAACALYPGVMEEMAERIGGDIYILPSSIHEVMLIPYDGKESADSLKTMISEINSTEVAPEEVLSDSLYHYSARKKKIELV